MSAQARGNIHASLVAVGDRGVLVTGPAGSGKSSIALSLLRAAAREGLDVALVADDRVELERCDARLFGRAPAALGGLVEIRGFGIVRLPVRGAVSVDLVAALREEPERMPRDTFEEFLGVQLRRVFLPVRQAPFCADLLITLLRVRDDAVQNI